MAIDLKQPAFGNDFTDDSMGLDALLGLFGGQQGLPTSGEKVSGPGGIFADNPVGEDGMSSEGPREKPVQLKPPSPTPPPQGPTSTGPGYHVGTVASPDQPDEPTPLAGMTSTPPQAIQPFRPLPETPSSTLVGSIGSMATPRLRGLYGSAGGLQGGGLGVPLDPTSNAASNPIDSLLSTLTSKRRTL